MPPRLSNGQPSVEIVSVRQPELIGLFPTHGDGSRADSRARRRPVDDAGPIVLLEGVDPSLQIWGQAGCGDEVSGTRPLPSPAERVKPFFFRILLI